MEIIGEGIGNKSIGKALQQSEKKVQNLEMELDGLRRSKAKFSKQLLKNGSKRNYPKFKSCKSKIRHGLPLCYGNC